MTFFKQKCWTTEKYKQALDSSSSQQHMTAPEALSVLTCKLILWVVQLHEVHVDSVA